MAISRGTSPFGQRGIEGDSVHKFNKALKPFARDLRKHLTDVEQLLWSKIRRKQLAGAQFYRQKPIGPYIVDFYCPAKQLVIELDGGQHFTEKGENSDMERDRYLRSLGFVVLRFTNRDVLQSLDGVLTTILDHVSSPNLP